MARSVLSSPPRRGRATATAKSTYAAMDEISWMRSGTRDLHRLRATK